MILSRITIFFPVFTIPYSKILSPVVRVSRGGTLKPNYLSAALQKFSRSFGHLANFID